MGLADDIDEEAPKRGAALVFTWCEMYVFRLVIIWMAATALATAGCGPPSGVAVQLPVAAEDESAEATKPVAEVAEAAAGSDAEDSAMIPVKNPLYGKKEPLLFDSGYAEDNTSCLVCHIDFKTEPIAAKHVEAGVTCSACHGDSVTHSADEYNISRPDVIWGRAEIDGFCKQCHEKHKNPKAVDEFRAEWLSKRRPNGRWVLDDSACTDCHGKHAIVVEEGDFK